MGYQNRKQEVWDKAKKVRGKDPDKYRKDKLGNEIYFGSYGKNTEMGWEIDHSKPKCEGGTDHLKFRFDKSFREVFRSGIQDSFFAGFRSIKTFEHQKTSSSQKISI